MIILTTSVIITTTLSIYMLKHSITKFKSKLAKKGYEIRSGFFEAFYGFKIRKSKLRKFTLALMSILPGINIMCSLIFKNEIKNMLFNNDTFIIKKEDSDYLAYLIAKKKDIEAKLIKESKLTTNEKTVNQTTQPKKLLSSIAYNIMYVGNPQLPPISYTLDEVKKLNDAIDGYHYKLGKVEDANIAIIGIFLRYNNFNSITFENSDYKEFYTFKEISDEEAKNLKFVVYPFMYTFDKDEHLVKAYEEIRKQRDISMYHTKTKLNNEDNNEKPKVLVKKR